MSNENTPRRRTLAVNAPQAPVDVATTAASLADSSLALQRDLLAFQRDSLLVLTEMLELQKAAHAQARQFFIVNASLQVVTIGLLAMLVVQSMSPVVCLADGKPRSGLRCASGGESPLRHR